MEALKDNSWIMDNGISPPSLMQKHGKVDGKQEINLEWPKVERFDD